MIDENRFFREATLAIVGGLKIEMALWQAFVYLQEFIPADEILLHVYDPTLGLIRTVARADINGGEKIDRITPLPIEARANLQSEWVPPVHVINHSGLDPVTLTLGASFGKPDSSVLTLRLVLEEGRIGRVTLRADEEDVYGEEHARLFSMLNEPFTITLSNCLRHEEVVRLGELLADDKRYLQRELFRQSGEVVVGEDFGLRGVMEMVRQVARLRSPVLLLGETGTGKEIIANAIHRRSSRRDAPFVKINCGAMPETLVESELFGHEKGAFTGAITQKRGHFERAHSGTIFLDEIGELPLNSQVKLLRVLQGKEIERIGGCGPISVDIRVIAASNRDLEAMVRLGKFREDLWFRLNVFPIVVPPLRHRKADIPVLVHHFLGRKSREMGLPQLPSLATGAIDQLTRYHWPGNVRELENVIERAIILSEGKPLDFRDLIGSPGVEAPGPDLKYVTFRLADATSSHIKLVLSITKGKINGSGAAAALLDIHPNTLRNKMKKLGIRYGRSFPSSSEPSS
jgi:formate hydrogenlyase transcriptional activator